MLLAGLVVCAGCKKAQAPAPMTVNGVSVDLPKLQEAFSSGTEEQRRAVTDIAYGLRYQQYEKALMALDQLSSSQGLTDAQKKLVAEQLEAVKKLAGATPAPTQ